MRLMQDAIVEDEQPEDFDVSLSDGFDRSVDKTFAAMGVAKTLRTVRPFPIPLKC